MNLYKKEDSTEETFVCSDCAPDYCADNPTAYVWKDQEEVEESNICDLCEHKEPDQ